MWRSKLPKMDELSMSFARLTRRTMRTHLDIFVIIKYLKDEQVAICNSSDDARNTSGNNRTRMNEHE